MVSVLTSINSFNLLIKQDFKVSYDALELNKDKFIKVYAIYVLKIRKFTVFVNSKYV